MRKDLKLHVMGRYAAEAFVLNEPYIHIAVITPADPHALCLTPNPHRKGVLELRFHDVSRVRDREWLAGELKGTGVEVTPFSKDHADQIAKFLQEHKTIPHIVVNCDAGSCRSPAIAAAISKVFLGDDEMYFKRYSPNHHVHHTLCVRLWEDKRAEEEKRKTAK